MVSDVLHGLGESGLEVDVVAVGQGQNRSETVSKPSMYSSGVQLRP